MSNLYLPSRFVERVHRLAAGVEPVDALRPGQVPQRLLLLRDATLPDEVLLRMRQDRALITQLLPAVATRSGGRFALLYSEVDVTGGPATVDIRLVEGRDAWSPRRFVPRRLRLPIDPPPGPAAPDNANLAERIHRPALFPGAAYDIHGTATAIRGRVVRGGAPVRWPRIEARRDTEGLLDPPRAWAHGDDRGEFLLVLPRDDQLTPPSMWTTVRITAVAPQPPPTPASALIEAVDPHWDLPVETLPATAAPADPVSSGRSRPWPQVRTATRDVLVRLGRIHSETQAFQIT